MANNTQKTKTFARMKDNKIVNIELATQEWVDSQEDSDIFIEYTDENPACVGGDYIDGYFYNVQPFPSWLRDNGSWVAPVEYPNNDKFYEWNEETISWVEIE